MQFLRRQNNSLFNYVWTDDIKFWNIISQHCTTETWDSHFKILSLQNFIFCSNILWALIVRIVTIRSQGIPRSVEVDFPLKHLNRFFSFRGHFRKIDKIGLFGAVLGWELAANWQSTWIFRSITITPRHSQKLAPLMCFQALIAARSSKNKRNTKGAYAMGKAGIMQLINRQCQIFLNVLFWQSSTNKWQI